MIHLYPKHCVYVLPLPSSSPLSLSYLTVSVFTHAWFMLFLVLTAILRTVSHTCIFLGHVSNALLYLFNTVLPSPISLFCILYCFTWKWLIKIYSTIISECLRWISQYLSKRGIRLCIHVYKQTHGASLQAKTWCLVNARIGMHILMRIENLFKPELYTSSLL